MRTRLETINIPEHIIIGSLDNVSVGHPGLLLVQINVRLASGLVKYADERHRDAAELERSFVARCGRGHCSSLLLPIATPRPCRILGPLSSPAAFSPGGSLPKLKANSRKCAGPARDPLRLRSGQAVDRKSVV